MKNLHQRLFGSSRRFVSPAFLLAWCVLPAAAAQTTTTSRASSSVGATDSNPPASNDHEVAQAQSAFAAARDRMNEGAFEDALQLFRRAAAVKNTPGLRYHIAYCLEQMGLLLEAQYEYGKASELLVLIPAADVAALLPQAQARVHRALPRLNFLNFTEATSLILDGKRVDPSEPQLVDPGPHHLSLEEAGQSKIVDLSLSPGEARSVDVGMLMRRPAAPRQQPLVHTRSQSSTAFWIASGVAAAGLSVGVTSLVVRQNAISAVDSHGKDVDKESGASPDACRGEAAPQSCQELHDSLNVRNAATTAVYAGFTAAAAGIVTAVVVKLLWSDERVERRRQLGMVPAWDERGCMSGLRLSWRQNF